MDKKLAAKELRKTIWDYTRTHSTFTSLELRKSLGIFSETAPAAALHNFLRELVYWGYLLSEKQGAIIRYYVML